MARSSKGIPFLALYTGQAKDSAQKINSDVALMRIRDREHSRRETGRSLDINGLKLFRGHGHAVNHGYGMTQTEPKHDPIFQDALEFFTAGFQCLAVGPHSRAFRDRALERSRIVDDFVVRVAHRRQNVAGEHVSLYFRPAGDSPLRHRGH